jgi:hypothetical protein
MMHFYNEDEEEEYNYYISDWGSTNKRAFRGKSTGWV